MFNSSFTLKVILNNNAVHIMILLYCVIYCILTKNTTNPYSLSFEFEPEWCTVEINTRQFIATSKELRCKITPDMHININDADCLHELLPSWFGLGHPQASTRWELRASDTFRRSLADSLAVGEKPKAVSAPAPRARQRKHFSENLS